MGGIRAFAPDVGVALVPIRGKVLTSSTLRHKPDDDDGVRLDGDGVWGDARNGITGSAFAGRVGWRA